VKKKTTPTTPLRTAAAALTDIGRRRNRNMDETIADTALGLFAVSDGMGGVSNGAEASKYTVKQLPALVGELKTAGMTPERAGEILAGAVSQISDALYERSAGAVTPGNANTCFGATLCALLFAGDSAVFVNIGDSRAYILRKGKIRMRRITRDHNWATDMVEHGLIPASKAKNHPAASALRRFCGMPAPAEPDLFVEKIAPGDKILLCSDGLYGMLSDLAVSRILLAAETPGAACSALVAAANAAGGRDNIAVVVICAGE